MEHARMFLEAVMPDDIGDGKFLNIHWSGHTSEGKRYWDGRATESIDEAVKTLSWVNRMDDKDIYVCMSSQSKCEEKTSAKGNKYKKAIRFADDAVELRSLFIDVDVKDDKGYPTSQEAMDAVQAFVGTVGLPIPTTVVASGSGGFHFHWVLEQALPHVQWQHLANALANATQKHELKCDSQCTVDGARILRVPNTFNRKHEIPAPVTLVSLGERVSLRTMIEALRPYEVAPTVARVGEPSVNDELGAGLDEVSAPKPSIEDVAKSCGFVRTSLENGGADNDQPLWFMSASVATCVKDGREALHRMSSGHSGYSEADTDRLYDRLEATKAKRDLGWPQCQKIAVYGCEACKTCPLLAQNRSPLNHATPVSNGSLRDDSLPSGVVRGADDRLYKNFVDEQGVMHPVLTFPYKAMSAWISTEPNKLFFVTEDPQNHRSKVVSVSVLSLMKTANDAFIEELAEQMLIVAPEKIKPSKEVFMAWVEKLQKIKGSVVASTPFGWSLVDGNIEGFAYGGKLAMPGDERPTASPPQVLMEQYTPRGNPQIWKDASKVIWEQNRPHLDTILAASFAAPLMRFTGFSGGMLNAYSPESGIGKTTAMRVAQAVWGSPTKAMQGLGDTPKSVINKTGKLRNLPVFWDEIKSEEQVDNFVSITFNMSRGTDNMRLTQSVDLKEQGSWETMMISASNESLVYAVEKKHSGTTAGLHRMFEFKVAPKPPTRSVGEVQRLVHSLDDNFGHAGLAYAKYLGENHGRIKDEIAKTFDKYSEGCEQAERFWFATVTAVMCGARYANILGLTNIDLKGLEDFLMKNIEEMRETVAASSSNLQSSLAIPEVISHLLRDTRARNTLVTDTIWAGGRAGRVPKDAVKVRCDVQRLERIWVQRAEETKKLRIIRRDFQIWLNDKNYQRGLVIDRLISAYGAKELNAVLGAGTPLTTGQQDAIIEIDLSHPKLLNPEGEDATEAN
jgi:hypothetical protein